MEQNKVCPGARLSTIFTGDAFVCGNCTMNLLKEEDLWQISAATLLSRILVISDDDEMCEYIRDFSTCTMTCRGVMSIGYSMPCNNCVPFERNRDATALILYNWIQASKSGPKTVESSYIESIEDVCKKIGKTSTTVEYYGTIVKAIMMLKDSVEEAVHNCAMEALDDLDKIFS